MGGAVNTIGSIASGGLLGSNPISKALGVSGEQGQYFQPNNSAANQMGHEADLMGDQKWGTQQGLADYASGNKSLSDVTNGHYGFGGGVSGSNSAFQDALATGASTGSKYATEQVQNNPVLGQLFGKGGALSSALGKEQELQNQGFKLTPEDREAYGQASGDVARMFGSQENSASQSLANRGLGAGPSGAAGVQFSGLAGNKNEMLAKAQTDIANQRMQNTMHRIGQQQQFASQLGNQAGNAIQDQYGRQLAGAQNRRQDLMAASGAQGNANEQNLQSQQDQRLSKGKTLLEGLGGGLMGSAGAIGNIPGQYASSMAGGGIPGMGGGGGGGMGGGGMGGSPKRSMFSSSG